MLKSKLLFLFLSSLLVYSCGQDYNSSSFDNVRYAKSACIGSSDFIAFCDVATTKCIACHTGRHSHWAAYTTPAEWQAATEFNLIVAGDIATSEFVQWLEGWGTIGGMPKAPISKITSTEYNTIKTWIESL